MAGIVGTTALPNANVAKLRLALVVLRRSRREGEPGADKVSGVPVCLHEQIKGMGHESKRRRELPRLLTIQIQKQGMGGINGFGAQRMGV
jgi:hypothetical protein